MQLHLETLDPDRKIIFEKLVQFKSYGYLAGGTALALQIGHRISYDFDIFCEKEISEGLTRKIRKTFLVKKILINSKEELTFVTKKQVKVSSIYYPFKLDKFVIEIANGINLLSPKGIAVAKAYTLGRRGSWRDYVDLFFIFKTKKANLKKTIAAAKKVYGEFFSEKLFLAQLIYTEDIDRREVAETKYLEERVNLGEVKRYFQKEVNNYLEK